MKIFDCFTFFNELEILEVRLNELYNVVDEFVLVESIYTHSGKNKNLYFNDNKEKFNNFLDKITHIIVKDMPNTNNPWDNESFQRQCIWRGLSNINVGDVILISDADEVPKAKSILAKKEKGFDDYNVFEQQMYYSFINASSGKWNGTKSFIFDGNKEINLTKNIRYKEKIDYNKVKICDAGWHFTYIGGVDRIQTKIKSFAHQELNNNNFLNTSRISNCLLNGVNPVHGEKLNIVDIDDSYPDFIINNLDKFDKFIKK